MLGAMLRGVRVDRHAAHRVLHPVFGSGGRVAGSVAARMSERVRGVCRFGHRGLPPRVLGACPAPSHHGKVKPHWSTGMNIGQAAAASGMSAKMIRYYESIALIPPSARRESGYRDYGLPDIHRLAFIRRARDLGFSIDQIRDLLRLWGDDHRSSAEVKRIALEHVAALKRRARDLTEMADALKHLATACAGTTPRMPDHPRPRGRALDGSSSRLRRSFGQPHAGSLARLDTRRPGSYLSPRYRRSPAAHRAGVAQLVRVPACHAGGRGFEPRRPRHSTARSLAIFASVRPHRLYGFRWKRYRVGSVRGRLGVAAFVGAGPGCAGGLTSAAGFWLRKIARASVPMRARSRLPSHALRIAATASSI